ncbi:hypothetical protein GQX74_013579 [Glossina fuscipes]|nr:hypothetical protein GQX74_013579 [Glossina fuscipes]
MIRFSGKYFRRTWTISTGNAEQSSRLNIFGDPELGIHVVTLQAMENSIFTLCRQSLPMDISYVISENIAFDFN